MKLNHIAPTVHRTHEGGRARKDAPRDELRRLVLTSLLWEDTFYESGAAQVKRLQRLVDLSPVPEVLALAREARNAYHLRHIPLALLAAVAAKGVGVELGHAVAEVIQRPDECGELIAIARAFSGKRTVPRQIRIGISRALRKFDHYQLAKWDQGNAKFSLADVVRLCHPDPGEDSAFAATLARVANRQYVPGEIASRYDLDPTVVGLPTPDTWEVALSAGADKQETFERLLAEKKLGGLALLRNLRGMLDVGVDESVIVAAVLNHPFHRVLPFRFIAAAYAVKNRPLLVGAIERAMLRALDAMPKWSGTTAVCVDVSGSMRAPVAARSEMTRVDVAAALGILFREVCPAATMVAFATDVQIMPPARGFAALKGVNLARVGHGTNIGGAVSAAMRTLRPDRIIVVTDMQSADNVANLPADVTGYMVNVAGYEKSVGFGRWVHVNGWSEGVVRFIQEYEAEHRTPTHSG